MFFLYRVYSFNNFFKYVCQPLGLNFATFNSETLVYLKFFKYLQIIINKTTLYVYKI